MLRAWAHEYRMVFHDAGVLLFFLALPLLYPVTYTIIYNPEVVRDIPMAVVDNCRSAESRELARMIDATEYIKVAGYPADMEEARRWAMERKVYAVLEIPADYSRHLGRREQAVLPLYCDMGLMLRYRQVLFAMTDVTLQLGNDIRTKVVQESPVAFAADSVEPTVGTESFILGDPTQGFASFIMIGIVILILQQSMVLGVLMLGGASRERRRANSGIDPQEIAGPVSASSLGRAACYITIYAPLTVYILYYVPLMFHLPQFGTPWQYLPLMLPFLLASIFLGQMLRPLVSERESAFLVFVFTSVVFLFLSGITWPRSAMSPAWSALSALLPATWGMQGFVGINSNGAELADLGACYRALWILTAVFFVGAVAVERWGRRHYRRHYGLPSVP